MSDISIITIDGVTYNVKDALARQQIATLDSRVDTTESDIQSLIAAVGTPLVASTAAAMTDHNKIYVYTGSETGYTAGNWYYWDSSLDTPAWVSGGVYNSTAFNTDTTLSVAGSAADAKATGDKIGELKNQLDPVSKVTVDNMLSVAQYPDLGFEIGNIGFTSSGWTYSNNSKRIRTPEGKGFRVEVGDMISLTSYTDARFYFGIYTDDGTYHNTGWNTTDKRCDYAGTCVILVSNVTEVAQTDVSDLASLVRISKSYTLPVRVANVEEQATQIGKDSLDGFAVLTYAEIPFEYGDITASENIFSYPYTVACLRTSQDFSIYLHVGDKIYLTDYTSAKFSAYVITSDDEVGLYGFRSTDLDIETEGYYKIRLCLNPVENIYDPLSLKQLIRIDRKSQNTADIETINSVLSMPHYAYDIFPVKGVSHRGVQYNAPENTMPAFKLSVQNGFKYIETDVQFTSDNIPVLIHDTTVDRTTNGTGNVSSFTFAQIEQLDAGSWFSEEFAGTRIPSLEEFLIFCKRTGVYPYLELKLEATYTQEQVHAIVEMVKHYDMLSSVSWISWSNDWLNMVLHEDKMARIGRGRNIDISGGAVNGMNAFKTGYNRVFWVYSMSASNITLTDAGIRLAKAANQDIEISVISTESDMNIILNALTESGYISGCLSNGTVDFATVARQRELS